MNHREPVTQLYQGKSSFNLGLLFSFVDTISVIFLYYFRLFFVLFSSLYEINTYQFFLQKHIYYKFDCRLSFPSRSVCISSTSLQYRRFPYGPPPPIFRVPSFTTTQTSSTFVQSHCFRITQCPSFRPLPLLLSFYPSLVQCVRDLSVPSF